MASSFLRAGLLGRRRLLSRFLVLGLRLRLVTSSVGHDGTPLFLSLLRREDRHAAAWRVQNLTDRLCSIASPKRTRHQELRRERSCIYNTRPKPSRQVIVVRLREMVRAYEQRTGKKLTYGELAERSGLARATVESLASRGSYNTTLATIDQLCGVLECSLHELIEYQPPRSGRKGSPKKSG